MTDRELMQHALFWLRGMHLPATNELAEKISARLAQPEPAPVAWMYEYGTDNGDAVNEVRWYKNVSLTPPVLTYNRDVVPLYTAPPQREWQGLTDEEIDTWNIVGHESLREFVRAIEAKLKEKNSG